MITSEINAIESAKNSALKANADIISLEKMAIKKIPAYAGESAAAFAEGNIWSGIHYAAAAAMWTIVAASPGLALVGAFAGGGGGGGGGFGRTAGAAAPGGAAPSNELAPGYREATASQPG